MSIAKLNVLAHSCRPPPRATVCRGDRSHGPEGKGGVLHGASSANQAKSARNETSGINSINKARLNGLQRLSARQTMCRARAASDFKYCKQNSHT